MRKNFQYRYGKAIDSHESFYLLNKAGHLDFEVIEDCYYGRRDLRDVLESIFHLYKCDECCENLVLIKSMDRTKKDKDPLSNVEPPKKLSPKLEHYLKKKEIT